MFGNYKFGDISKSIYNTVSGTESTSNDPSAPKEETKVNKDIAELHQKGYQFGDITKSLYNKWSDPQYEYSFGDITKTLYRSITAQSDPFSVEIKNPIKEGFLQKRCPILLIYTKYWVVLEGKYLYIFNGEKDYIRCIEAINLLLCDGVRALPNGVQGEFEILSPNVRHRFVTTINERTEWIQLLLKTIGAQKLHETKESVMSKNEHKDEIAFDLQCIAYYIIDLEYTHSESGDPQTLLRNQNFVIAMLIWSYVHDEENPFYLKLIHNLDDDQQQSLKYWQHPIAVAHGIHGGLQGLKNVPRYACVGGLMTGTFAQVFVVLPLSVIGATIFATAMAPVGFAEGFCKKIKTLSKNKDTELSHKKWVNLEFQISIF